LGWPVYIENKPDLVKFVAVMVDVFLFSLSNICLKLSRPTRPYTAIEKQKGEPIRMVNNAVWYLFVFGSIPQNVNKP